MKITGYSFGQMAIDGKSYRSDIFILPEQVIDGWWRKDGNSLSADDLLDVLTANPHIPFVGTGNSGWMQIR